MYVTILPETGKIADGIKRALLKVDDDVRDAAKRWKKEIEQALDGTEVEVKVKADSTQAKKEIESAAKDKTVTVEVDADTHEAEVEIDRVSRDRDMTINVNVKTGALARQIAAASGAGAKGGIAGTTAVVKAMGDTFSLLGSQLGGILKQLALIGAFQIAPNIVPAVGQVVSAVGQLSGLLGLLPGVIAGAALAFGSLKIGMTGFADALKEIGDPAKFAEAIKQLSPAAQEAATAIQRLWPQLVTLRMTVQDALSRGLGEQFEKLGNTYIPMFQGAMSQVAAIANRTFAGISEMLSTPEMQSTIQSILDNLTSALNILGQAIQPFVHAITDILQVSSTFMPGLATTIYDLANRFSEFISKARESGDLARWIQTGIDAFTNLKDIIVNTWGILSGLFRAAAGPEGAGGMLENLSNFTTTWNNWVNSPTGQNKISTFFADAKAELDKWWPIIRDLPGQLNTAFQTMADAVGPLITALGKVVGFFERMPGGIEAVVYAFIAWKTIAGVAGLITSLNTIVTLLRVTIPAAATAASAGMFAGVPAAAAAATGAISAAFSALGVITIPVAFATIANEIMPQPGEPGYVPNAENARARGVAGLAVGTATEGNRLPGQNLGRPPANMPPGTTEGVTSETPGAVPMPGENYWIIPGMNASGTWVIPPRSAPSGGREPQQNLPPSIPAPALPPGPQPESPYQPPTPTEAGGGTGGAADIGPGTNVAPSGFDWDAVAKEESGGNWSDPDSGGTGHYGGLQFSQETWDAYGGKQFASRADYATREDQMTVADRTAFYGWEGLAPQGLAAWEVITKGLVPGITTATVPPRPTPQYGSALTGGGGGGSGGWQMGTGGQPVFTGTHDPRLQLTGTGNAGAQVNLQPSGQFVGENILKQFPGIANIGTVRPDQFQWHPSGRGLDVMIKDPFSAAGKAQGDQLNAYLQANKEALGIANTLWQVADHFDHIHISMKEGISPALQQALAGGGGFTNDKNNPMYTSSVDEDPLGAKALGQNIISGMLEIFGIGDIFPNPLEFGLFKIFKSIMGLKPGGGDANGGSTNADNGSGGGGNGLLDWATSLIPNAGGGGNTTVAQDLMGGGGSTGGITDFASQFVPNAGGGNNNNNNNFTAVINNPAAKADTPFIMDTLDTHFQTFKRNTP